MADPRKMWLAWNMGRSGTTAEGMAGPAPGLLMARVMPRGDRYRWVLVGVAPVPNAKLPTDGERRTFAEALGAADRAYEAWCARAGLANTGLHANPILAPLRPAAEARAGGA